MAALVLAGCRLFRVGIGGAAGYFDFVDDRLTRSSGLGDVLRVLLIRL